LPELADRRGPRAALLSGGQQQMLVIARALAGRPEILMLDGPSLGLAPVIAKRLIRRVVQLTEQGVGVLLVEQYATPGLGRRAPGRRAEPWPGRLRRHVPAAHRRPRPSPRHLPRRDGLTVRSLRGSKQHSGRD
jgi:hypothetical protein